MDERQEGRVGSTVSDGLWTGDFVDFQALRCEPGFTLVGVDIGLRAVAENFHGGESGDAIALVRWRP